MKPVQAHLKSARRLALLNGGSVALIALLGALVCGIFGYGWGVVIGLLFAVAGGIELRGAQLLINHVDKARYWLCGGQLYFLLVVISYAGWRLTSLDVQTLLQSLGPEMVDLLKRRIQQQNGLWLPDQVLGETLLVMMRFVYWALIVISLFYQGLMFFYYARKVHS
ncbi:MAG TPA: hypothetical protein VFP95_04045 [Gammaproteobacteria bacterium]|nr:hypothetical protein [Gammaproteobacteria bacterium]